MKKNLSINSEFTNQAKFGTTAWLRIPQVFPPASLICPCSPQVAPHEFLTNQTPSA